MKSFIGQKKAWNTSSDNPYITYAVGIKEEGELFPTWCSSAEQCWNLFMNELITNIELNKDKNIIWRSFPQLSYEEFEQYPNTAVESKTKLWRIFSRYCFE